MMYLGKTTIRCRALFSFRFVDPENPMKLPSFELVLQGAFRTFLRFPFVLSSALLGTVSALILVDHEGPERATVLFNILFASILGIPLLFGLTIVAEKRAWGRWRSLGAQALGIALLVGYAFTVPTTLSAGPAFHMQRLLVLLIALHLFVSVGPFLSAGEQNGFWPYNKTLLFRILGALLYSHILYLGLTLALAALDQLFTMNMPGKRYAELWIMTFGVLNTWLFLAGIPEDLKGLDRPSEYPKSLKILVNYALAPLAIIYVVIVYAYIAKIVFSWEWSEGWISKLILGFSATGILSLLLLHPARDSEDAGWLKPAFRWFYVLMIPPALMFPLALWRRISEYGITEARYGAAVLAVWLIFIVAYFLLSKAKSIKVIPASLGVFALVVGFGSWGMFHVSEQSQTGRLQELLVREGILVDGSIRKPAAAVRYEDSKQISSILDYLHDVHGFDGIQPWFGESLRSDSALGWKDPVVVAGMLGAEYVKLWPGSGGGFATFSMNQNLSLDVRGFDRMVRLQYMDRGRRKVELREDGVVLELSAELDTLMMTVKDGADGVRTLGINLHRLASELITEYSNESVGNVPAEKMTVSGMAEGIRATVFLRSLQIQHKGETMVINNLSADIFYTKAAGLAGQSRNQ